MNSQSKNFIQANTQDFLCPTVREAGCPWNHADKEFILPINADQMDDSANQENAGNLSADDTCGRNGHIGFDFKTGLRIFNFLKTHFCYNFLNIEISNATHKYEKIPWTLSYKLTIYVPSKISTV